METVKRVRYFEGEFLHEADFIAEQEYHRGQQLRHNRLLHTPGIAEGLEVTAQNGSQSISVSKGTAIDGEGQLIVLLEDSSISIPGSLTGSQNMLVVISLAPKETDPDMNGGNTRYSEEPLIELVGAILSKHVQLARVNVEDGQVQGAVDTSVRQAAAVRMREDATLSKLTLANQNFASTKWPSLTCSAENQVSVNGALTVGGNVGIGIREPQSQLHINGNTVIENGALKIISSTADGKLLQFGGYDLKGDKPEKTLENLYGTYIEHKSDFAFFGVQEVIDEDDLPDKTVKTGRTDAIIAWGDDENDYLRFVHKHWTTGKRECLTITPAGNVGIGTTNPLAKLHVVRGNIVMEAAANNAAAKDLLNTLPNNSLIIGGDYTDGNTTPYTPGIYFYWKDRYGTKYCAIIGKSFEL